MRTCCRPHGMRSFGGCTGGPVSEAGSAGTSRWHELAMWLVACGGVHAGVESFARPSHSQIWNPSPLIRIIFSGGAWRYTTGTPVLFRTVGRTGLCLCRRAKPYRNTVRTLYTLPQFTVLLRSRTKRSLICEVGRSHPERPSTRSAKSTASQDGVCAHGVQ